MIFWFIFGALAAGMAVLLFGFQHLLLGWHQHRDGAQRAAAEIIAATEWDSRYRTVRQIPKYFATPSKRVLYSGSIGMNSAK